MIDLSYKTYLNVYITNLNVIKGVNKTCLSMSRLNTRFIYM